MALTSCAELRAPPRTDAPAPPAAASTDCNRVNDDQHGPIDTREKLVPYDPDATVLLREVYGDTP